MVYTRRILDQTLDDLMPGLAAIALEGAKGVGKTATALQRASTVYSLDDPFERTTIEADLSLIEHAPAPVFIDEWQLYPPVWDRVRRAVDADNSGGRFLLAGSADVAPGTRIHSGAGRIVSLVMRPLSFAERGLAEPTVSLSALLEGREQRISGETSLTLADYTEEILRSGFPGIRDLPERLRVQQLDSYLTRIVDHELPENGMLVRHPAALRAWLAAYGAATATDASYTAILDAATPGEAEKPARQTIASYREHLSRIFVLDPIEAWVPVLAPLRRLTKSSKHFLVDTALAARLTGVDRDDLLHGKGPRIGAGADTWLGSLFESLAAQSVRVYADAAQASVGHLRTKNTEHEIDLIVYRGMQRTVAIEVKLKGAADDRDVRHLNWLKDQLGDRITDRLVITTGRFAYRRPDGVAVVPLALLGP
ncbi:ATP-binding protein [Agromyces archimandritae]|uniref:ATP-binding protein n=1 Tax=Agromyces archimandritae TaxID=2781962 RepID=A0A975FPK9_9MICO|nr:DUF4143 domain-containing protein [Agromyces archimandritae]QTX05771.1 ATP-binding protein [Agromyces archimandritae]